MARPHTRFISAMFAHQFERLSSDFRIVRNTMSATVPALRSPARACDFLYRLAAAAELKDCDTGEHIIRMGHFSLSLRAALGKTMPTAKPIFTRAACMTLAPLASRIRASRGAPPKLVSVVSLFDVPMFTDDRHRDKCIWNK